MFLIERLFGVGTYTTILLFVSILIAYTNVNVKKVLKVYTVLLCVMGFFYTPYKTADLYRIYSTMDWYATYDFITFFKTFVITSSAPVSRLIFWAVGKTGVNNLLPVISSYVCYSVLFYIVYDMRSRYGISRRNVALTLMFLMSGSMYISVAGGFRMMVSMSLIVFCLYRETILKEFKILNILLYICAVFTHNMGVAIFAIRILTLLFDEKINKKKRARYIMNCVAIGLILAIRFREMAMDIVESALGYLFGDTYSYSWEYLMGAIILIHIFYIMKNARKNIEQGEYTEIKSFSRALMYSTLTGIVFFFVFTLFYRFVGHLSVMLIAPVMMVTLQEYENNSPRRTNNRLRLNKMQTTSFILTMIILLISCSRGSLSSLKFFVL